MYTVIVLIDSKHGGLKSILFLQVMAVPFFSSVSRLANAVIFVYIILKTVGKVQSTSKGWGCQFLWWYSQLSLVGRKFKKQLPMYLEFYFTLVNKFCLDTFNEHLAYCFLETLLLDRSDWKTDICF